MNRLYELQNQKKIKTINQAVIINDAELVIDFLNSPKINKKHFKSALINAINYNRESLFYLLFNFNKENEIVKNNEIFFNLISTACIENQVKYLEFLKNNLSLKSLLLEYKHTENFDCVKDLLHLSIQNNSLEALQFLLTDNNEMIKQVLNHKTSALTYDNTVRKLFKVSCSISKITIVKYLFDFNVVKEYHDILFFFHTLENAIVYNKFNTCKFIYKKITLSNKDILNLIQLSIQHKSYNFFKFLLKENPQITLDYEKITKSICYLVSKLSESYKTKCEKAIQFIEYLIKDNIHFKFSEVLNYTGDKYVKDKLTILFTQQKIQGF